MSTCLFHALSWSSIVLFYASSHVLFLLVLIQSGACHLSMQHELLVHVVPSEHTCAVVHAAKRLMYLSVCLCVSRQLRAVLDDGVVEHTEIIQCNVCTPLTLSHRLHSALDG